MEEFLQAVEEALGNWWFLLLYAIAMLLGFFLLKGRRKPFLVPALILTLLVFNPWLRDLWEEVNDYGYWRILWVIPVIPVIAAVPAVMTERAEKVSKKILALVFSVMLVWLMGTFVYQVKDTTFRRAANADKLPAEVTESAKVLLEQEENPRVVSDPAVAIYLRQYSGKFKTPYGRDIHFGEPSQYAKDMVALLQEGEMEQVAQKMRAGNYTYLVTANTDPQRAEKIRDAGFELIQQVAFGYGVYRLAAQ